MAKGLNGYDGNSNLDQPEKDAAHSEQARRIGAHKSSGYDYTDGNTDREEFERIFSAEKRPRDSQAKAK